LSTRALLVYPQFPDTYWSFSHALPFIGKRSALPPLGLLTVAAMLPEDWDVRLLDLNVEPLLRADVESSDIVLVSAMIAQKTSFERVVRLCNDCDTMVVAGGPYPTSSHRSIQGVDVFVLGEAELSLSRLLADLEAGRPRRLYRSGGRADLAATPAPRFDLVDLAAYDSMPLQYSRGCPYSCEFCDIVELFGHVQRTKAPAQFARELDAVLEAGFRGHVFVVDDNFVGNRRKTRELLRTIVEWQQAHRYPFTFSTEASIDLAQDPELLALMRDAAFTMVFVGLETPDQATLAHTGKSQNLKASVLDSVRSIQGHGIEVAGGFVIGFDTDPPDIFDRQIRFVSEAAIPTAMVGLLTALPGTRLHRRLESEGRLLAHSSGNNTHDLSLNFVPRMDMDTLIAGYKRVITEVYRPARYFERCAELLRRMPPQVRAVRGVSGASIRALLMSLVRQGFSSYGLSYLRFLAHAALTRPAQFPDAVCAAIKGYHFFAITRRIVDAEALTLLLARYARSLGERVAVCVGRGRARLALGMRRSIIRALTRVRRRYRALSAEMRTQVEQAYEDFLRQCRLWLAQLRPAAVRVRVD
jgi:radical SAM superfamily enzyme YgiQ (UPF0313 family)